MKEEEKKNKLITMILLAVASVLIVAIVGYDLLLWGSGAQKRNEQPIVADSGIVQKVEKDKIFVRNSISGKVSSWQLVKSIKYKKLDMGSGEFVEADSNDLIVNEMVTAGFVDDEKMISGLPDSISISPLIVNGEVMSIDSGLLKIKKQYLNGNYDEFNFSINDQVKVRKINDTDQVMLEVNIAEIKVGDKITVYTNYMMADGQLIPSQIEVMNI